MSLRLHVLGSSSSGNCALLESDGARVLIDAGLSARRIAALLKPLGVALGAIDAVFVTHEHGDHAAGLEGLAKAGVPAFYGTSGTAAALRARAGASLPWRTFEAGSSFPFRDLAVTTFSLPHDAMDPVGYVVGTGGDDLFRPRRSVAWATDLGFVTEVVRQRVLGADVLVLEANYDDALLDADEKRPWSLKQRIKGRHGHLSNAAAHAFLRDAANPRPGWRRVLLGHLSKECNDVDLLRALFREPLPCGAEVTVLDPTAETVVTVDLGL